MLTLLEIEVLTAIYWGSPIRAWDSPAQQAAIQRFYNQGLIERRHAGRLADAYAWTMTALGSEVIERLKSISTYPSKSPDRPATEPTEALEKRADQFLVTGGGSQDPTRFTQSPTVRPHVIHTSLEVAIQRATGMLQSSNPPASGTAIVWAPVRVLRRASTPVQVEDVTHLIPKTTAL